MLDISELIEVTLNEPDDFLKVRETLSRIGVASKKDKILYQSCHILHKRGKYYLVHFKQMFLLDGKPSDFSDEDRARLNTICNLLQEWKLVNLVSIERTKEPVAPLSMIKIISHKERGEWNLVAKYNIGKKRKEE